VGVRPPRKPDDIFPQLVADLRKALGDDLLGVAVFGSAAGERYRKDLSDINLMLLLTPEAARRPSRLIPWFDKWQSAAVAPPVVVTPEYLERSRDVFPIELIVMAAEHRCLYGRDPLAELEVAPEHLRLQLERELKAKLMALRTHLVASGGARRALLDLCRQAWPAFGALFKAYLHLTQGRFPNHPRQALEALAGAGVQTHFLSQVAQVAEGQSKPNRLQLKELIEGTIFELETLSREVDRLSVEQGG